MDRIAALTALTLASLLNAQQATGESTATPRVTTETVRSAAEVCTIRAENADIHELIWSIARQASANVVVAPEVTGTVSVDWRTTRPLGPTSRGSSGGRTLRGRSSTGQAVSPSRPAT